MNFLSIKPDSSLFEDKCCAEDTQKSSKFLCIDNLSNFARPRSYKLIVLINAWWISQLSYTVFELENHYEAELCILGIVNGFRNKDAPILFFFFCAFISF